MKNLLVVFIPLFICSSSLFGQAQVALANDDGSNRIIGPSIGIEIIHLKSVSIDDCGSQMQFHGTVHLDLGGNNGSLTYSFNSPKPTNYLNFKNQKSISSAGYSYSNVEFFIKVYEKDNRACKSLYDIVDINDQSHDNTLKIRVEGNKVWLLSPQNQKIRILGAVGQTITMRGNRYVNNNTNTQNNSRDHRNSRGRSRKWYQFPPNNVDVPDIEVGEIKFVVREKSNTTTSPYTIPNQQLPSKATTR